MGLFGIPTISDDIKAFVSNTPTLPAIGAPVQVGPGNPPTPGDFFKEKLDLGADIIKPIIDPIVDAFTLDTSTIIIIVAGIVVIIGFGIYVKAPAPAAVPR